jgi:hypothetical protein
MEGGIAGASSSSIQDPNYRFELYQDWKGCRRNNPNMNVQRFCKNKGLSQPELESLVREFDSLDPKGEKWNR